MSKKIQYQITLTIILIISFVSTFFYNFPTIISKGGNLKLVDYSGGGIIQLFYGDKIKQDKNKPFFYENENLTNSLIPYMRVGEARYQFYRNIPAQVDINGTKYYNLPFYNNLILAKTPQEVASLQPSLFYDVEVNANNDNLIDYLTRSVSYKPYRINKTCTNPNEFSTCKNMVDNTYTEYSINNDILTVDAGFKISPDMDKSKPITINNGINLFNSKWKICSASICFDKEEQKLKPLSELPTTIADTNEQKTLGDFSLDEQKQFDLRFRENMFVEDFEDPFREVAIDKSQEKTSIQVIDESGIVMNLSSRSDNLGKIFIEKRFNTIYFQSLPCSGVECNIKFDVEIS
jgi:hypothetical protein